MSLDLAFSSEQLAVGEAVAGFCRERVGGAPPAGDCPADWWQDLAELGVLELASPDGEGGALDAVAAFEELGAAAFPGPVVEALIGGQVLRREERAAVARGALRVSVGTHDLAPFVPGCEVQLEVSGQSLFRAPLAAGFESLSSLDAEPVARGVRTREERLERSRAGLDLGRLLLAAYLVGAARRVVALAADHARTRTQFGRPIGDFQAVAHPLADVYIGVASAETLTHAAACEWDERRDEGEGPSPGLAAAAWLAAREAALEACHVAHQVMGAQGMTLEGPLYPLSRRIRQRASHAIGTATARESMVARLDARVGESLG